MRKFLVLSILLLTWLLGCGSEQQGSSAVSSRAIEQLGIAVALNNEATAFSNQLPSPGLVSASDFDHLRSLWSDALVEARKVDIAALNADEPGFGDIFRDKFIRGLELCTQSNDPVQIVQGQLLLDSFGNDLAAVKARRRSGAR